MPFVVTAKWIAKPGEEEAVANVLKQLAPISREEPGNVLYFCHRDPESPQTFYLYEQYVDRAAYDAHGASPHFQTLAFGDAIPRLEARERAFYETWDI